jgi:FkbM family methyltransferase
VRNPLGYRLDRFLSNSLPPLIYCRLSETLRPLFNPARRGGPRRKTGRDEDGLYVRWETGQRFYFAHPILHNRYVWPNGVEDIRGRLLVKYQDGPVRLAAGDVVLEAGAHVGEFSTAAARIVAQVYTFEPDPKTFACLKRNTEGVANIAIHNAGLGERDGTADFFISRTNADSSFLLPDAHEEKLTVPMRTIASVMDSYKLAKLDFLKVEAEGYEPEILKGCGARLRDVAKVAVDCGPERHGKDTYAECEAVLKEAGFRTWRREEDWMLFATNGAMSG